MVFFLFSEGKWSTTANMDFSNYNYTFRKMPHMPCSCRCFFYRVSAILWMSARKKICWLFKKVLDVPCLFFCSSPINFGCWNRVHYGIQTYFITNASLKGKTKDALYVRVRFINHWNNWVACICFNLIVVLHFFFCTDKRLSLSPCAVRYFIRFAQAIDCSIYSLLTEGEPCNTNNRKQVKGIQNRPNEQDTERMKQISFECHHRHHHHPCRRLNDVWHIILCESSVCVRMAIGELDSCH